MSEADAERERPLPIALNAWQGKHAEIFSDDTPELDVEGSRMCAKTTLCLDKELHFAQTYPGIKILIFRYADTATRTKLMPRFEEICRIRGASDFEWDNRELCYNFANGSKVYAFGLKARDANARYEKLRGLDVARVYCDQAEELPADIGQELRASLRQKGFPRQLTFSPNPVNTNHWLADKRHGGFPIDNSLAGRRFYELNLYDNRYNLDADAIASMERTYPPDHAKHGAMILGKRGFNVIGDTVFEETFNRQLHLRALHIDFATPLFEGFDFGKHNPCWCVAQRFHSGGLALLGGIIGENLFLEDFLPIVQQYREEWFDAPNLIIKSCCPPPGANIANNGTRFTNISILHQAGFKPRYRDNANAADVRLALLEQFAGYMRRRNASGQESFAISNDESRWLKASRLGIEPWPFMAQAFEAGIVWDEHFRSVSNNPVRQVKDDDWFANVTRCVCNIELNFCANKPTEAERRDRAIKARQQQSGAQPLTLPNANAWMVS